MKTKLHFVLALSLFLTVFSVTAQQRYWQKLDKNEVNPNRSNTVLNQKLNQAYRLDIANFKAQLANAPLRSATTASSNAKVYLPNLKGELEQFIVVEAPVLSKNLALEYPNIKTYLGFSTLNPGARARFSLTPQGLQCMVSYPDEPTNFLVPLLKTDTTTYLLYSRDSNAEVSSDFECLTEDEFLRDDTAASPKRDANDQVLRTLRIAISTTGEYTNYWNDGDTENGNAQEDALAQVVSSLNRMNEIFEVDMAVTFTLVTGTEIIFESAISDPYSSGSFNSQLQSELTTTVGEANYDIGHLIHRENNASNNNGNAGCIGCVCVDGEKGSGFSSHAFTDNDGGPYVTDFFDVDYLSHEIGHQMGARHTFSMRSEGAGVNVEPGSGSTIMGYAGIEQFNDVQDHSDPYFHYASINQILNNLETRTCWVGTTITNSPPVADAGSDYNIPVGTAFVLKGAATDADAGDVLTYTWEQIDDGVTTYSNFGPTKTSGAVWRSRPPSTVSDRYMPIIERVISGELTETNPVETVDNSSWETVSNVGRTLSFALTVRDRSEANGVGQTPQSDFDTMAVTVDAAAGPFVVTSQSANQIWDAGSNQTVAWDVAGTDVGAVNTPTVNILLSTDGGYTFPYVLMTAVPNDGEQLITVPFVGGDSTTARVKVEGNNNIFYAINSTNFTIQESEFVLNIAENTLDICAIDTAAFNFTYNTFLGFSDTTTFSTAGLPPEVSVSFSPTTATANATDVIATLSGLNGLAPGNYPFEIVGTSGTIIKTVTAEINIFNSILDVVNLQEPTEGAQDVQSNNATFTWTADVNAESYEIDIATDASFTTIVENASVTEPSYTTTTLNTASDYFWRVRSSNDCGTSAYSERSFSTADIFCASYDAADTPIDIPDSNPAGINSVITIPEATGTITDINVTVNISHNWTADLELKLIAPNGTEIVLSNGNGADGDNYTNTTFDSDAVDLITSGTAPFTGSFQPEGDLTQLNGSLVTGDWTLNVADTLFWLSGALESWSIEICELVVLSSNDYLSYNAFKVYPNPNEGTFNIVIDQPISNAIDVVVFDINGRQILKQQFSAEANFNQRINLGEVASGVYLMQIKDGNNLQYQKVVVR